MPPSGTDMSDMNLFEGARSKIWESDDRLVRLYYENFHVAHPVLVPSALYYSRDYPQYLQLVVNLIGSHYLPSGPSQQLKDAANSELTTTQDRSPCMVQAWLLYSISLYARDDWADAQDAISKAATLATELGMQRREYTSSMDSEQSIEAESMRRTWWELYLVDIMMSVSLKPIHLRCSVTMPEVSLPCEESVYAKGTEVPIPTRFMSYKSRIFAAEETLFSSFSYRIDAMMILCRVLVLNQVRDPHRDHLQAIENALVSWVNHLPPKKLDIIDAYGNVDEMMFQAHIVIAYAAMLLHLPRSELQPLLPPRGDVFWPCSPGTLSPTFSRVVHSIKATEASRRISDFVSICPNIQKHTPLIIPALGLCGMIQLATSVSHSEECLDHHCNRVTLVLGCLRVTRRTWNSADTAFNRVRTCAAEVLCDSMEKWNARSLDKPGSSTQLADNPGNVDAGGRSLPLLSDNHTQPPVSLPQGYIDSTCYDTSLFNYFGDFEIS